MEAKHTPGPWRIIKRANQTGLKRVTVVDHTTRCVVQYDHSYRSDEVHPRDVANAHLIAAAPELLAALQSILEQSDDGAQACAGIESSGRIVWKGSYIERLETARAVIAKSLGTEA